MKSLQTLLVVCLVATSAFAVIDPDPDMMGIYFDLDANDNCLTISPSIPFNAYLILTNPTPSGISAYEFGLEVVIPAGMENLVFRLANYPYWGPSPGFPDYPGLLGGDYFVGLASPVPASPSTVLHVWQYMLLSPVWMEMFIHSTSEPSIPGELPIVLTDEGILMQVGLSTGGPDIPVATVNRDCVVGVEGASFGSVKALFR
jgi:hypothetical protein